MAENYSRGQDTPRFVESIIIIIIIIIAYDLYAVYSQLRT